MSDQTLKPIETETEPKPCFIITPIGEEGSEVFTKAMGLIKSVIQPVLKEFDYFALPANDITSAGSINKQVIEHIVNDEIVIANLTGFNPNVMYELAIRHSYKKKVIIMAEKGPKLPFDIQDQRTIFYHDTLHGVETAKVELRNKLKDLLDNEVLSNPIIDAVKQAAVLNNIPAGDNQAVLKYIVEKLDKLETLVFRNYLAKDNSTIAGENLERKYLLEVVGEGKFMTVRDLEDRAIDTIKSLTGVTLVRLKVGNFLQGSPKTRLLDCKVSLPFPELGNMVLNQLKLTGLFEESLF